MDELLSDEPARPSGDGPGSHAFTDTADSAPLSRPHTAQLTRTVQSTTKATCARSRSRAQDSSGLFNGLTMHKNDNDDQKPKRRRKRRSRYNRQGYLARQTQLSSSVQHDHTTHESAEDAPATVSRPQAEILVEPSSDTLLPDTPRPISAHSTDASLNIEGSSSEITTLGLSSFSKHSKALPIESKKRRVSWHLPAEVIVYDPELPVVPSPATSPQIRVGASTGHTYNVAANFGSPHNHTSELATSRRWTHHMIDAISDSSDDADIEADLDKFEREVISMLRQRRRSHPSWRVLADTRKPASLLKRSLGEASPEYGGETSEHLIKKVRKSDDTSDGDDGSQHQGNLPINKSRSMVPPLYVDTATSSDEDMDQSPLASRSRRNDTTQVSGRRPHNDWHARFSGLITSPNQVEHDLPVGASSADLCSPLSELQSSLAPPTLTSDVDPKSGLQRAASGTEEDRSCDPTDVSDVGSIDLDAWKDTDYRISEQTAQNVSRHAEVVGSHQFDKRPLCAKRNPKIHPCRAAPATQPTFCTRNGGLVQRPSTRNDSTAAKSRHLLLTVDVPRLEREYERDTYIILDDSSDGDVQPLSDYIVDEGQPFSPLPMLTRQREDSWGCDDPNDPDFIVDKREWTILQKADSQVNTLQDSALPREGVLQTHYGGQRFDRNSSLPVAIHGADREPAHPSFVQTSQTLVEHTEVSDVLSTTCSRGSGESSVLFSATASRASFGDHETASDADLIDNSSPDEPDQHRTLYEDTSSDSGRTSPCSSPSLDTELGEHLSVSPNGAHSPELMTGMRTASPPVLRPRVNGLAVTNLPPSSASSVEDDLVSRSESPTTSVSSDTDASDQRHSDAHEILTATSTVYSGTPPSLHEFIARRIAKSESRKQGRAKQVVISLEDRSEVLINDGEYEDRKVSETSDISRQRRRSLSPATEQSGTLSEEPEESITTKSSDRDNIAEHSNDTIDPDDRAPYGWAYLDRPIGGNGPHSRMQPSLSQGLLEMHAATYTSDPVQRTRAYLLGKKPDDGSLKAALRDDPLRLGGPRGPHYQRRNI